MKTVRLTKLSGAPESSISPGYEVEGPISREPEVGKKVCLDGYIRDIQGNRYEWFHTTEATAVVKRPNGWVVTTKNSEWLVRIL